MLLCALCGDILCVLVVCRGRHAVRDRSSSRRQSRPAFPVGPPIGRGRHGRRLSGSADRLRQPPLALKILLRQLLDDPDFLQRFENEAASTGRIRHPNVVTIYESGQGVDGTPYIAMEYLEGESLRHALKTRGPLPVAECAEILQQAARGLAAAHKLGIIHRDLKPDNIFLMYPDDESVASASAPTQVVTPASPPAKDAGAPDAGAQGSTARHRVPRACHRMPLRRSAMPML